LIVRSIGSATPACEKSPERRLLHVFLRSNPEKRIRLRLLRPLLQPSSQTADKAVRSDMIRQKIGQYRVLERLGAGGMGSVYRAVDETLGRDVALKVLDTSMEDSTARLRAEAAALARLSHPGIATVFELVEDDTHLVMVMELVRGQTLQHIVDHVGAFSARRAAELCMQALEALAHAHASGVVHRDLKPGNLMMTDSGLIKVMDFGIARLEGSVNLTGAGAMLGTPAYMAPEQVLGHPVDARADLYAMGLVFFRLITAGLPFKGDTPFDMAQSQVRDTPLRARDLRADLPQWVDDILTRALAKKPVDRFQSAVELHEAFARAIADVPPQPVVAAPVEATEVMARPDFSGAAVVVDSNERGLATIEMTTIQGVHAPRRRGALWVFAGVAAILVGSLWMFDPFNSASRDAAATAALAVAEAAPQSGSVPPLAEGTGSSDAKPKGSAAESSSATKVADAAPVRPASAPAPAESSAGPALATASFSDVKLLAVNGSRTEASDVRVHLSNAEISVESPNGKAAPTVLTYRGIAKATYTHEKDPKWDSALSGPAGKINVPGILGRARHWLPLWPTARQPRTSSAARSSSTSWRMPRSTSISSKPKSR
jgi:serine/threonine-protein kinase